jgi:type IV pilus assembly protein PilM
MPSLPTSKLNPSLSLPKLSMPSLGAVPALKRGGGRGRGGNVVGLDIEPGYVSAVRAHVNGGVVAERAAGMELPPDTMREGEVREAEALTQTLQELFDGSGLPRQVRIGVANQRTVLRTMELPPLEDRKELAAAVRFQAQEEVPMPLDNAILDFHPLGIHETASGPRQQVVLVAAQRDMIKRLLTAVHAAGLQVQGVDLSAFALIRSLYRPAENSANGSSEESGEAADSGPARVLYLNVDGLTNMAIAEGDICRFTRVVGGGLEAMAGHLAERLTIPVVDARTQIAAVDLSSPEGEQPDEARLVLVSGVREIAGEVRNSLDFHRSQDGGGEVAHVVLSGAALDIPGFADAFQAELGVPVTPEAVGASARAHGERDDDRVSPRRLAIAAGLAVEEAPR